MVLGSAAIPPVTASASNAHIGGACTLLELINGARDRRHLPVVSVRTDLTAVAEHWAAALAEASDIAHNPNLAHEVPGSWTSLGENVGVGYSVTSLHSAFMASKGHRANILGRGFNQIGIGLALRSGQLFVVEVFAARSGGPRVSKPCGAPLTYTGATSGLQGQRIRVAARLDPTRARKVGAKVRFELAGVIARARIRADGLAVATMVVDGPPGPSSLLASYRGYEDSILFKIRWPQRFTDRDAETSIYLNPSSKQFVVVTPTETTSIRRSRAMQSFLLPTGHMVTVIPYETPDLRIDGVFEYPSRSFTAALTTATGSSVLLNA